MEPLFPDADALVDLCRRHGIGRLSFAHSFSGGTANEGNDVCLVAEFMPGATPGFFGIANIEEEISTLLRGRLVHLRTPEELSRYRRAEILGRAHLLYSS